MLKTLVKVNKNGQKDGEFYWMILILEEIRELDIFENRSMAMAEQNTPGKQLVPV